MHRDPGFANEYTVLRIVRAFTIIAAKPVPYGNEAIRYLLNGIVLETMVQLLNKTTLERHDARTAHTYAVLCEDIASLLSTCANLDHCEYFEQNNGYFGLVIVIQNIIERPRGEHYNIYENTLRLVFMTLVSLQKRYPGVLLQICNANEGQVKLHVGLISMLKSPHFEEETLLSALRLCEVATVGVFKNTNPNELANALASFFAAGKSMQLYRSVLASDILQALTVPSYPSNDWTPLLCVHLLHFLSCDPNYVVPAFKMLLLLQQHCNRLWVSLLDMVANWGVEGVDTLVNLVKRSDLRTPDSLHEWLQENGDLLKEQCNKVLVQRQIRYNVFDNA